MRDIYQPVESHLQVNDYLHAYNHDDVVSSARFSLDQINESPHDCNPKITFIIFNS